jgi:hypothetical protein
LLAIIRRAWARIVSSRRHCEGTAGLAALEKGESWRVGAQDGEGDWLSASSRGGLRDGAREEGLHCWRGEFLVCCMVSARHCAMRCDGPLQVFPGHATLTKEIACASSRNWDVRYTPTSLLPGTVDLSRQGHSMLFRACGRHSLPLPGDDKTSGHSIS